MIWEQYLVLGIFLGGILTALAVRFFPGLGLLDYPERYNLKRSKIPYPGGIALVFGALILGGLFPEFYPIFWPFLLLAIVSFWDDRWPLPSLFRLGVHLLGALWVFWLGAQISYIGIPWAETNFSLQEAFPFVALVISLLWIISIQNAINWFDALPGLSVGVSGLGFGVLAVLGLIKPELFFDPGHLDLTLLNFGLMGLCIGAFPYYYHQKIILGDSGSQTLGFLLAVLSIWSGAKIATTLLVLALPILDFGFVIVRRVLIDRKSPFSGDLCHFPHNLSKITSTNIAVLVMLIFSFLLGLIPLLSFFSGWTKIFVMIFLLLLASGVILFAFVKSEKTK